MLQQQISTSYYVFIDNVNELQIKHRIKSILFHFNVSLTIGLYF